MKRRGFLGFLGGAAVAGPAMAKQAAQTIGMEAMALPSLSVGGLYADGSNMATGVAAVGDFETYDHAQWLRDRIAEVTGISDAEKRERAANAYVSSLDADLAVNRSFSLQAKIEMQKRRNVERELARDHKSLSRELASYLKRQLLS